MRAYCLGLAVIKPPTYCRGLDTCIILVTRGPNLTRSRALSANTQNLCTRSANGAISDIFHLDSEPPPPRRRRKPSRERNLILKLVQEASSGTARHPAGAAGMTAGEVGAHLSSLSGGVVGGAVGGGETAAFSAVGGGADILNSSAAATDWSSSAPSTPTGRLASNRRSGAAGGSRGESGRVRRDHHRRGDSYRRDSIRRDSSRGFSGSGGWDGGTGEFRGGGVVPGGGSILGVPAGAPGDGPSPVAVWRLIGRGAGGADAATFRRDKAAVAWAASRLGSTGAIELLLHQRNHQPRHSGINPYLARWVCMGKM